MDFIKHDVYLPGHNYYTIDESGITMKKLSDGYCHGTIDHIGILVDGTVVFRKRKDNRSFVSVEAVAE